MKKITRILLSIVVVITFLSIACFGFLFYFSQIHHETEYTKDYSEKMFKEIKPGMSYFDVTKKIGQPFYTNENWKQYKPSEERWWYSRSPSDTNYKMREVRFDNTKVKETVAYHYVD